MRNFNYFMFFVFAVGTVFTSCDEEEDPFAHIDDVISDFGDPQFNDTLWSDTANNAQKIVIEDFTGHKCPNCPLATDVAKSIIAKHPDNVMVVALHNSNNFSKPDPPKFPANFETETGENLRLEFNLEAFPVGIINRIDFDNDNQRGITLDLWEDRINSLLNDSEYMSPSLDINYMVVYNTENRLMRIFPEVSALEAINGEVYLAVYVLESGIVSPQEDNRRTPPVVEDYVHEHMLRVGFEQNDIGTKIFDSPTAGEVYRNDSIATADVVINEEWNADSLEVVVYAYNRQTKEIIQASKLDLAP